MKPTKQQVMDVISIMAECPMSLIKYDYKKKEFSFVEFVPTPHYDSGHGIDAIDYEEIPRIMSWKKALRIFRYYKNSINTTCKEAPAPVCPVTPNEDELPF